MEVTNLWISQLQLNYIMLECSPLVRLIYNKLWVSYCFMDWTVLL